MEPEIIKKIQEFYNSDSVSLQASGKRDVKSVKNLVSRKQEQVQLKSS